MNLPNWISIFRILCIPLFIGTLAYYSPDQDHLRLVALAVFLIAVISDAVDGYIARTRHLKTRLGSFIDPLADKLLLTSSFICLAVAHNIPPAFRLPLWVPILFISRDVILVIGAALVHIVTGDLKIAPSPLGKLTTFFQMATVIMVLLQGRPALSVCYVAAFFTIVSGFEYLLKGSRLLSANGTNHQGARVA